MSPSPSSEAHLAMAVVFPSDAAAQAAAVDAWRVRVTRPPATVLFDEGGEVAPLDATVTVQVSVTLDSPCEDLSIEVELLARGEVWFRSAETREICTGPENTVLAQELEFVRPFPEIGPILLDLDLQAGDQDETSFRIAYSGADGLDWSAVLEGGSSWLGLPVSSGSVSASQPFDVPVEVDARGLGPGSYAGRVIVTGEGFPGVIGIVEVRLGIAAGPAIGLAPSSLLFAAFAGSDPPSQTFAVTNTGGGTLRWTAGDDADWLSLTPSSGTLAGGATRTVTASVTSAGLPAGQYQGVVTVSDPQATNSPRTLTISLDVVQPGFTIVESLGSTQVDESGTSDDFTVVLDVPPASNVTLNVGAGDPTEAAVNPDGLVFTPSDWNVAQTVTVTGVDDAAVDGDQISQVTVSVDPSSDPAFATVPSQAVTVITTDDDVGSAGFTVTESGGTTIVAESGTSDDLSVVLNAQPQSTVVLNVSSSDTGEATVTPAALTFSPTDWNLAQTVTVTGVNDPLVDGDQNSTVTISVDPSSDQAFIGLPDQTVGVTTTDDDVAGDRIAFADNSTGDWEIYVMNADGSGKTNLSNRPGSDERMPTWSPDRSRIAFTTDRDGNWEIYVMSSVDGSGQVNLTNNPAADESPKWSPAGGLIAFETNRDGNREIYTMTTSGGSQTNRTNNAAIESKATWSPDGARIAFDSDRGASRDIWVMNANGTNPVQLTTDPLFDSEPAWSPDGTRIAFRSNRVAPTNFEIYVMDASGSNLMRLTVHPGIEWNPTWSSNSQEIVFSSDRDVAPQAEIYVMNADGSNVRRLTNDPFFSQWWPAWFN